MALINCPNCGRKVSDRANKCPHCGVDIKSFAEKVANSSEKEEKAIEVQSNNIPEKPQPEKATPPSGTETTKTDITVESVQSQPDKSKTDDVQEKTEKPVKSSSRAWIWVLAVSLIVILAGCGVGGYFYYQNVYLPEKIDREAPRTYPIVNIFVRSSKDSGGEFNKVGLVPCGGELITYEQEGEWSKVKYIPVDPTQPVLEGYVASSYLLSKSDFDLLNGIFGNDEARQVIESAKCRRAILNYYKDNGLIGKAVEGDTINPRPTDENQWQIFLSSATEKPNEVFFKRVINSNSKFTDFAVVMRNIVNNEGRILYFTFDDDETPHLFAEYDAKIPCKIKSATYYSEGTIKPFLDFELNYDISYPPYRSIPEDNVLAGHTYEGTYYVGDDLWKEKISFVNDNECIMWMARYDNEYNSNTNRYEYIVQGDYVIIHHGDGFADYLIHDDGGKIILNFSGSPRELNRQ